MFPHQGGKVPPHKFFTRSPTSRTLAIASSSSSSQNGGPYYTTPAFGATSHLVIRPIPTWPSLQQQWPDWSKQLQAYSTGKTTAGAVPEPHPSSPMDLSRLPSTSSSVPPATQTSDQSGGSASAFPLVINKPIYRKPVVIGNGARNPTAVEAGGAYISNGKRRMILHYQNPQHSIQVQRPPPSLPVPQAPLFQIRPSAPVPPMPSTFSGLCTTVADGSFSDRLISALEENYLQRRLSVMTVYGELITPQQFLKKLCDGLKINYHVETTKFSNGSVAHPVQFRTEIYAGGFCGVGHALTEGFSSQLAAAHVLERMRVYIPEIKQKMYALYPGNRYTRIGDKLEKVCQQFKLGEVAMKTKTNKRNRWGWGREAKYEIDCFVLNKVATVCSDNELFGTCHAKMRMYLDFVKPPKVPVVHTKDYFALGGDCPKMKDIHPSLFLYKPSPAKVEWMREYKVGYDQLDGVLTCPINNSGYLRRDRYLMDRKIRELREKVGRVLAGMRGVQGVSGVQGMRGGQGNRKRNGGMANRGLQSIGGGGGGMSRAMKVPRVEWALDVGADGGSEAGREGMDKEDKEVEDIFFDAQTSL